jgi:23S rRNA (uracil1939-C5)-methyltransferase
LTNSGAADSPAALLASTPLQIEDLLQNGQGVGRAGELVTFVSGALPGERVRVAVDALKKSYATTHAVEILERSPDRVAPPCPVFGRCGGCQTLHLRYEAQLEWKRRVVAEALARLGGITVDVAQVVASPLLDQTRYRNKVSLVPMTAKGGARIGFYEARSHHVVPIDACPVALPWLDDAIRSLANLVAEQPGFVRDLAHVVVRTGLARQSLVVALCSRGKSPVMADRVAMLRGAVDEMTGVVESYDPPSANAIFGRRTTTLWGSPQTVERVGDVTFHFGAASFFQINTAMLERIVEHLERELCGFRRVVDLYGGVGTFAVMLARRGVAVTGVESSAQAVDEAAANAARNGATSVAFERATAAEALSGRRGQTLLEGTDAVIVDPPRRGCEPEVLQALAGARVPRIEYLSCNPATLARDARLLVDAGYSLDRVPPFDMFPFTGHVEALAEFRNSRNTVGEHG